MKKYLILNPLVGLSLLAVGYFAGKKLNKKQKPKVKTFGDLVIFTLPNNEKEVYLKVRLDENELEKCEYACFNIVKQNK